MIPFMQLCVLWVAVISVPTHPSQLPHLLKSCCRVWMISWPDGTNTSSKVTCFCYYLWWVTTTAERQSIFCRTLSSLYWRWGARLDLGNYGFSLKIQRVKMHHLYNFPTIYVRQEWSRLLQPLLSSHRAFCSICHDVQCACVSYRSLWSSPFQLVW